MHSLTHWGQMTHICVSKLTIIGSDNGLSPCRRQAIIWTNAGILLIRTLGTNLSEIFSKIRAFSFKNMHLKMSSAKRRPFCLGLNVLTGIRTWTSIHAYCLMWDVIIHACPNFNGGWLNWAWRSYYIPLFSMDFITYPCPNPDAGLAHLS